MTTVLLVWPYYPPDTGAASLRGAAFARGLAGEGLDVHVLTTASGRDESVHDRPEGVRVHEVPLFHDPGDVFRWPQARSRTKALLDDLDPDLVVASTPPPTVAWQVAGPVRDRGIPLVVDVRDLFSLYMRVSHGRKLRYHLTERMEARLYAAADALLTVGSLVGDQLADRYGVPRDRLHVVRNGTDLSAYEDLPDVDPDVDVLYLGTFEPGRRGEDLLRAYRQVLEERPGTTFAFVGWEEDDYVRELAPLWDEPPLRDALTLQSPVPFDEVPRWVARSRLGVLPLPDDPSYRANVARKTYDYLAGGAPPVVLGPSGDAELRTLLHDNEAGRYTDTVEGFADALVELLGDEDGRRRIAANARELGKRFDLEGNVAEAWDTILAPLAGGS